MTSKRFQRQRAFGLGCVGKISQNGFRCSVFSIWNGKLAPFDLAHTPRLSPTKDSNAVRVFQKPKMVTKWHCNWFTGLTHRWSSSWAPVRSDPKLLWGQVCPGSDRSHKQQNSFVCIWCRGEIQEPFHVYQQDGALVCIINHGALVSLARPSFVLEGRVHRRGHTASRNQRAQPLTSH